MVKPVQTTAKFDLSLLLLDSTIDVWPLLNVKTVLLKPNEPLYFKSLTLWISSASCNTVPWVQNQVGNGVQNLSPSYKQLWEAWPNRSLSGVEDSHVLHHKIENMFSVLPSMTPLIWATDSSRLGKKTTNITQSAKKRLSIRPAWFNKPLQKSKVCLPER